MSKIRFKVEYKCDCGIDYGSCDRKSMYLYEYNCSCDIGTLVHYSHYEDEKSKPEYIGAFTDNQMSALIDVLTKKEGDRWTEQDHEILKEARQW